MKRTLQVVAGSWLVLSLGGCPNSPDLGTDGRPAPRDALSEGPRLGTDRTTQQQVLTGELTLDELRSRGLILFTTSFNQDDGYGDGPMDSADPLTPGGRPTLQGNGVFLRVNGLDAQSCIECHSVVSNATVPPIFGVGGAGASVTNAVIQPSLIDVLDSQGAGLATFTGRFANPPFLFGAGGVELLAKEMTRDLQILRSQALENPGVDVRLITKGVDFGTIRFENGELDPARVEGIDDDLVVRPFGRKGEFTTVRAFAVGALQFHFGMQPVELVGQDVDHDGDGVMNEILVGELTALHVFGTTLSTPIVEPRGEAAVRGAELFLSIGCADCHVPILNTQRRRLPYSFPEVATDPFANEFLSADLADEAGFDTTPQGGLVVPLFSDLKRHDMGPELAETFGVELDPFFVTARLWGIADTAPYLHDGRAMTLGKAILMHGGEGQDARDTFADLGPEDQENVVEFLRALRTPLDTATGLG